MKETTLEKLAILAESAKYDVSCSSSGSRRTNTHSGLGNTVSWGICHSFTADGRCISLLKVMLTNFCMYDCAYCINRRSNDIKRTAFSPKELANLTIGFYRRNYIEGLFLSSGIIRSPDHTMENMLRVIKSLRTEHNFHGYIHMKAIPGTSPELVYQAGLYADRLSVNIEIPTENKLKWLAPDKDHQSIYQPMRHIQQNSLENLEDRRRLRSTPKFVPAGQSTQLIVGATDESDADILQLSAKLYRRSSMKRVYYSGYMPINQGDKRLPQVDSTAFQLRENRLYQADWLLRYYQFNVNELVDTHHPNLDLTMDPKLMWAIRHPEYFPIEVNRADYHQLLRVPGIGVKSAKLIVAARRHGRLDFSALKKLGVVMKRAQYFIHLNELTTLNIQELTPDYVRRILTTPEKDNQQQQLISSVAIKPQSTQQQLYFNFNE